MPWHHLQARMLLDKAYVFIPGNQREVRIVREVFGDLIHLGHHWWPKPCDVGCCASKLLFNLRWIDILQYPLWIRQVRKDLLLDCLFIQELLKHLSYHVLHPGEVDYNLHARAIYIVSPQLNGGLFEHADWHLLKLELVDICYTKPLLLLALHHHVVDHVAGVEVVKSPKLRGIYLFVSEKWTHWSKAQN